MDLRRKKNIYPWILKTMQCNILDCLSDGPCAIFLLNSQNKMIWQALFTPKKKFGSRGLPQDPFLYQFWAFFEKPCGNRRSFIFLCKILQMAYITFILTVVRCKNKNDPPKRHKNNNFEDFCVKSWFWKYESCTYNQKSLDKCNSKCRNNSLKNILC